MTEQKTQTEQTQPPKYLELTSGSHRLFVTNIRLARADGQDPKSRTAFKVTLAGVPTSVSFTAPYTIVNVNCPKSTDSPQQKIAADARIASIILPLLDEVPGGESAPKRRLSDIERELEAIFEQHDIEADVLIEKSEGSQVDSKTGEYKTFTNLLSLTPIQGLAKGQYDSAVDYEG